MKAMTGYKSRALSGAAIDVKPSLPGFPILQPLASYLAICSGTSIIKKIFSKAGSAIDELKRMGPI